MLVYDETQVIKIFGDNEGLYADVLQANDEVLAQINEAKKVGLMPNSLNAPLFVLWELTSRCPQNCIYCYNNSPSKVNELSSRRMFQIADELIKLKVFHLCITGGEPTMHKHYYDLIRYLSKAGIMVATVLSGVNISRERAEMLSKYLSVIQVSLDGSKAEIHDRIRKRNGSFADAINAIKLFVSTGMDVNISFAITRYNADDLENTYLLCKELGVSSVRTQKLAISGKAKRTEDSVCASEEQYKAVFKLVDKYSDEGKLQFGDATAHIKVGLETGIATLARITAEGDFCISPYFSAVFGNIKDNSILECWNRMKNGWQHPELKEILGSHVICEDQCIYDKLDGKIFIGGCKK